MIDGEAVRMVKEAMVAMITIAMTVGIATEDQQRTVRARVRKRKRTNERAEITPVRMQARVQA